MKNSINDKNRIALLRIHWVEGVLIRSYSGPYFSAFGQNTERYGASLRIQSEC